MKLSPIHISIIKRLLSANNQRSLKSILNKVSPQDLAGFFSQLNDLEKHRLFTSLMNLGQASDMLYELPESQVSSFLKTLSQGFLNQLLMTSSEDKGAYLLNFLKSEQKKDLLLQLPDRSKATRIEQFLNYPENSAGRLMEAKVFTIPIHFKAKQALNYLRTKAQENSIYYIYCTDRNGVLEGVLNLRELVTADDETPLSQLIKKDIITLSPETSPSEVARIVSHYNFIAIPVVNSQRKLLGLITIDSVVDILQEEITASAYVQAGLQENDRVFSSFSFKFKNRLPWLALNLGLASLASLVINYFESTIQELIILASLINVVAGLGGSTAIQTFTIITRGLATGDFNFITKQKAILKEILVGAILGMAIGLLASVLVYLWKGNLLVAGVIFVSILLNCLLASIMGTLIPLTMERLRFDPAIGSSVLVIMFTDIFSFFSFLGIATLGLKWVGHF